MQYVICYNGIYETVGSEYVLEVRIEELMEEGFTPDDVMVFDIETQVVAL